VILIREHIVEKDLAEPIRLLDFCVGLFEEIPSKKGVKKAIQRGEILLNGEQVENGRFVRLGDKVQLVDAMLTSPKPYKEDLRIPYIDEHLAIVYKPAGLPVSGNQYRTLQNVLVHNIEKSSEADALPWSKPVHRLDSATQGLVVIARTRTAIMELGKLFEHRAIQKTYNAVISGFIGDSGIIEHQVEDKESKTTFKTLQVCDSVNYEKVSLVEYKPHTGRTHQLRIHSQLEGAPIIGDVLYGEKGKTLLSKGLFLAAIGLEFQHPITDETLVLNEPVPAKFLKYLEREQARWNKYRV